MRSMSLLTFTEIAQMWGPLHLLLENTWAGASTLTIHNPVSCEIPDFCHTPVYVNEIGNAYRMWTRHLQNLHTHTHTSEGLFIPRTVKESGTAVCVCVCVWPGRGCGAVQ